jgi:hypothetical protein
VTLEEQIRAIVRDEFERLQREHAAERDAAGDFYSSAKPAQLPITKRKFLEHARAGAFPSFKRGKTVLAKRADVDAWIAGGERDVKPANDSRGAPNRIESIMRRIGGQRG